MGRDMICQGQNSDMEPMENGASDVMGPGRLGPELTWCYDRNNVCKMHVAIGCMRESYI